MGLVTETTPPQKKKIGKHIGRKALRLKPRKPSFQRDAFWRASSNAPTAPGKKRNTIQTPVQAPQPPNGATEEILKVGGELSRETGKHSFWKPGNQKSNQLPKEMLRKLKVLPLQPLWLQAEYTVQVIKHMLLGCEMKWGLWMVFPMDLGGFSRGFLGFSFGGF